MKIALDLDDVIRDYVPAVIGVYNHRFNTEVQFDDIKTWDIINYMPKMGSLYGFMTQHPWIYDTVKPICGVKELMQQWRNEGHTIHILTRQFKGFEYKACDWICKNELEYDTIIFAKDKSVFKADIFVDDNLTNFNMYRIENQSSKSFLMSKPWNQHVDIENRIYTLSEILRYTNEPKHKSIRRI